MRLDRGLYLVSAAAVSLCTGDIAQAQQTTQSDNASETNSGASEQTEGGLQDIVVTAQKRGENIQRVPITITALQSDALDRSNITNSADLQSMVPGLVFSNVIGNGQPYLRGVGNDSLSLGADSSVSMYVDGVYMARTGGAIQEFFDVDRVEVVKGPQGTLFGRNTVGGSILVVNKKPTEELEFAGDLTLGNNQTAKGRGALNLPLTPNLFLRASAVVARSDGFFRNLNDIPENLPLPFADFDRNKSRYGGTNVNGGRVALRWLPTSNIEVNLIGDASIDRSVRGTALYSVSLFPSPAVDFCRGAPFPCPTDPDQTPGRRTTDPYRNYLNISPTEDTRQSGLVGNVAIDLDWAKLASITAYRHYSHKDFFDLDGTDYNDGLQSDYVRSNSFTQELQLASLSSGRLQWVAGLYFLRDKGQQRIIVSLAKGNQIIDFNSDVRSTAYAAYGQGSYEVVDGLKLTLGARYSYERKRIGVDHDLLLFQTTALPLTDAKSVASYKAFTPKFGIDWQVGPRVMLYASAQKGFKSGGYNTLSTDPATFEFQPEKIWAYEAGVKSTLLEGSLRANASFFYYDYKDLQVSQLDNTAVVYRNAAAAKVKGIDLDLTLLPVKNLQLGFSAEYLDSTFDQFVTTDPENPADGPQDLSGNRLVRAPKFAFNASALLTTPLGGDKSIDWFLEYAYTGRLFFEYFNRPGVDQREVGLLNGRITLRLSDSISVAVWGRNLTDKAWNQNILQNTAFAGTIAFPAQPRTFGMTLSTSLGG